MNDIHNIIKTTIDNLTDKTNFNLILSLVQQKIFQNNKNNILCDIDNENKNIINHMSDIKLYNKYYSTNLQLIENINLFDILKSFNKQLTVIEPFAGDCDLLNIFKNELCKSKEIIMI